MQMGPGKCSPHPNFSSAFPWGGLFIIVWGIAATLGGVFSSAFFILIAVGASIGGIGQDALASKKFVEAGMVLGHGVPSLFCGDVAVTAASGYSWRQKDLLPLGSFLWDRGFPQICLVLGYTQSQVLMWLLWLLILPLAFGLSL